MSTVSGEKKFILCECVSNKRLNEETSSPEFLWKGPAPAGGQFFLVRAKRSSVFLGRPISVAAWIPAAPEADAGPGVVRFIILKRGRGTEDLIDLRPGEKASLTGPLGNSWASVRAEAGAREGKIALVSGGVGVAPLACFGLELRKNGGGEFDFYAGFRGKSYGLEGVKPSSLVVVSEDGSEGKKGRVTDFFSPGEYGAVFACGPLPMLKAVSALCAASGVPCFVSMEKHMACGTGACLGCAVKTRSGNKRCCSDGPVFDAAEINFDE